MEHQEGAILAQRLRALANNLFWTWHPATQRLFERVDPLAWRTTGHSPVRVLEGASPERLNALIHDSNYLHDLEAAEQALERHLNTRSWYEKHHLPRTRIAYFSMEFALHESLPIYSGGLGVLAGDHLKSASDLGVPLCAVGLMYHRGFYTQRLDRHGDTVVEQPVNDPELQPLTDTGVLVDVPMGRRTVTIGVWKAQIGRVPLYLLDANVEENRKADRELTAQLYSGDNDMRIKQEILLGIGGMLALDAVGEKVRVCHLNEGHAAFCALARIQALRERGISLEKSVERVRDRTVFTTHTPVPAGHDRFDIGQTWRYVGPMAQELGFEREQFIDLGREADGHGGENFCMTVLALNLSGHRNGVSKLHGHVSREMWREVFGVDSVDDV
ncbi:MAG: alpha-glucan family phosphorylase, partial [Pseudomonadota bacterium]